MPSSTLHQLTRGLICLRVTLFIFKTFHLHEENYVLSLFQILHSSNFPPYFCAINVNPTFLAIALHRVSMFSLDIIFCFALFIISYIVTLCIKGPFFRYMYLLLQNVISSHYGINYNTLFQ